MQTAILVREAKQGSTAAQRYLFEMFCGRMRMFCLRYVKSAEDAEEIMLDGFFHFYRALPRFIYKDEASLHSWIKKIMLNECLGFLRKKHRFTIVSESEADESSDPADVMSHMSATEIFELILSLPIGYRTVFNLHVIEGFEHQEIAAALHISTGTSKSQLSKARQLLQKMINNRDTFYERNQSK